jgi:hypothetical protein
VKEYTSRVFIGILKLFQPAGSLGVVVIEILLLLAKHGSLPFPVDRLAAGELWLRSLPLIWFAPLKRACPLPPPPRPFVLGHPVGKFPGADVCVLVCVYAHVQRRVWA